MRLDKFLKVSRVLKRRTVAAEACDSGHVTVNGKTAKPSHQLKVGDVVAIAFAKGEFKFAVNELLNTSFKDKAEQMYTIISSGENG